VWDGAGWAEEVERERECDGGGSMMIFMALGNDGVVGERNRRGTVENE